MRQPAERAQSVGDSDYGRGAALPARQRAVDDHAGSAPPHRFCDKPVAVVTLTLECDENRIFLYLAGVSHHGAIAILPAGMGNFTSGRRNDFFPAPSHTTCA